MKLLAALGIFLALALTTVARADMYQDGSNAKVPTTGTPTGAVCVNSAGKLLSVAECLASLRPDGSNAGLPSTGTPVTAVCADATGKLLTQTAGCFPVKTNAQLATLPSTLGSVWRLGVAAAGDAPPVLFTASGSTCPIIGGDVGSQNPTSDGKCWIASYSSSADFREWGAVDGTNVDTALSQAIAYACSQHVPIYIPNPVTPYILTVAHVIGNGSPTALSTCNKVLLFGSPQYPDVTSGTSPPQYSHFVWAGSGGVIPIDVRGPAASINLMNIGIDCAGICATGFKVSNTLDSEYGWLGVSRQIGPAYILISTGVDNTWHGGFENNYSHDLLATLPGPGGSGGQVGDTSCGGSCTTAVITSRFERLHWLYDGNTAGTYGIRLGTISQSSFASLQLSKVDGIGTHGDCMQVDAPAAAYPDTTFIDGIVCDTDVKRDVGVAWAPLFGGIHITNWQEIYPPPSLGAPLANGYAAIWGTTGRGTAFGAGPWAWTPVDLSGAGLTLTPFGNNWMRTPHGCDVHVDFSFPATANGSVATVGGLPPICVPYTDNTAVMAGYTVGTTNLISLFMNNAAAIAFYAPGGIGYTNAAMSGVTLDAELTYTTAK